MQPFSRPEKGGRYDADAVPAPVGALTRADHDRVEKIGADAVSKPKETLDVVIDDVACELRLDSEHAAVGPLDDQVDLVLACSRPEMLRRCLGRLRVDADIDRDERLEQRAEKRPVAWDRRA